VDGIDCLSTDGEGDGEGDGADAADTPQPMVRAQEVKSME
jgi:hypothetical protein